jgi:hypothetical protein
MPSSKNLLPDLAAGPGVTLPGNSKDGLRVSLIKHLAGASNFCVSSSSEGQTCQDQLQHSLKFSPYYLYDLVLYQEGHGLQTPEFS